MLARTSMAASAARPAITTRPRAVVTGTHKAGEGVEHERELEQIVRSTEWLMRALVAARAVDPPDWLISAGAIRTAVWDRLHGYERRTPLADIDLGFFDPHDLSEGREREIRRTLEYSLPEETWDVKNQAAVHLWYRKKFGHEVAPLGSTAAAVATFPETAVCVGVRLRDDDSLRIAAPYGLDDLFDLVHRRNPAQVSVEEYERRLASKRVTARWPRVTVLPARR
jgi:uncharacterized protein